MNKPAQLLIVLPCYNEEAILQKTNQTLQVYCIELANAGLIAPQSKICYVDDGSRDSTWGIIEAICQENPNAIGLKLSRNFGHQSALLAGLEHHAGQFDCYITIDADLQDDIRAIENMLLKNREGARIVYGVRDDRSNDSWFKRQTAESFYGLMQNMGVPVVYNHADFRLIDDRVLREFQNYRETNMFLRGMFPLMGFQSEKVFYKRLKREAGETKYPLKKMVLFAWNGITSFSTTPMRMVLYFGLFNFLVSLLILGYAVSAFFFKETVPGWTSTLLPLTFFSGSNMVAVGLIGEYVGKIYEEVKARPRFIIEKTT